MWRGSLDSLWGQAGHERAGSFNSFGLQKKIRGPSLDAEEQQDQSGHKMANNVFVTRPDYA